MALNGILLSDITHANTQLSLSGDHVEECVFVFHPPVLLTYPWLSKHNPQIYWAKGSISEWSTWCHENCLRSATPSVSATEPPDPSDTSDLFAIPKIYHDRPNDGFMLFRIFKTLLLTVAGIHSYSCSFPVRRSLSDNNNAMTGPSLNVKTGEA